jgi:hypothetical protein
MTHKAAELATTARESWGHLEKLALAWPWAPSTPVAAVGLAGQPARNSNFSRCSWERKRVKLKKTNYLLGGGGSRRQSSCVDISTVHSWCRRPLRGLAGASGPGRRWRWVCAPWCGCPGREIGKPRDATSMMLLSLRGGVLRSPSPGTPPGADGPMPSAGGHSM